MVEGTPADGSDVKADSTTTKATAVLVHKGSSEHPLTKFHPFKLITFLWVQPLLSLGARRPLQLEDIWEMPPWLRAKVVVDQADAAWQREVLRAKAASKDHSKPVKPVLMNALVSLVRQWIPVWFIGSSVFLTIQGCMPNLMRFYLEELQKGDEGDPTTLIALACSLPFSFVFAALTMPNMVFIMRARVGTIWRFAIQGLVYRAVLGLRLETKMANGGQIMNLMSVDSERFFMVTEFANSLQQPILLLIFTAVLIHQVGLVALIGIVFSALCLPLQVRIGAAVGTARRQMVLASDKRLRATSQCLGGIRLFKMNGWTPKAYSMITSYRAQEVRHLSRVLLFRGMNMLFGLLVPPTAALLVFGAHAALGGTMTPALVFPALTMLKMIQMVMTVLPQFISQYADFKVAKLRVESFFIEAFAQNCAEAEGSSVIGQSGLTPGMAVEVLGTTFEWRMDQEKALKELLEKTAAKGKGKGDKGKGMGVGGEGPGKGQPATIARGQDDRNISEKDKEVHEVKDEDNGKGEIDVELGKGAGGKGVTAHKGSPSEGVSTEAKDTCKGEGKGKGKNDGKGKGNGDKGGGKGTSLEMVSTGLQNITLCVPEGSLCVVVGPVGSGKTSLLCAVLGEMWPKDEPRGIGRRFLKKGLEVALCGQEPWIRSATMRENILLNEHFKPEPYHRAMDAAALLPDLASLPDGEETEIGEKGINLSGGQRARVALARALYRIDSCDLFLLDDPLSAVDSEVGRQIIDHAMLGLLAQKTRIVVANTFLDVLLPKADMIVVMKDGRIEVQGGLQDVLDGSPWLNEVVGLQISAGSKPETKPVIEGKGAKEVKGISAEEVGINQLAHDSTTDDCDELEEVDEQSESETNADGCEQPQTPNKTTQEKTVPYKKEKTVLYEKEDRAVGALSLRIYRRYFDEVTRGTVRKGHWVLLGLLMLMLLCEINRTSTELWIAHWTSQGAGGPAKKAGDGPAEDAGDRPAAFWIGTHAAIVGALIAMGLARTSAFMNAASKIARNTHDGMLSKILRAPVATYFDVTPQGRLLNRFSRDLDSLDMQLPVYMLTFLDSFIFIVFTLIITTVASYLLPVVLVPLAWVFVRVRRFFAASSRELKRLEGITRSPLYSTFQETLAGLLHVRAYGLQKSLLNTYESACDQNFVVFFHQHASGPWLAQRLNLLVAILVGVITLSGALLPGDKGDPRRSALVGFALSSVIGGLMGRIVHAVINSVETENHMTSVERLHYFDSIPQEDLEDIGPDSALWVKDWPLQGALHFENVKLRYRKGLPLALRGISFSVAAGEKVGLVGRTGSGKSTVLLALLRMLDVEQGKVYLDGVDTLRVPLQQLRGAAVSIIPQEPYLFEGTLRENLDPFITRTDNELNEALELTGITNTVHAKGGLDARVAEGAENFSAGEKQLLCIARAFLRRSSVVLLDEATARLDSTTDSLVQQSIRTCFASCTVIAIAHRLQTVLSFDRILVLAKGRLVEEGTPVELLRNPGSRLGNMAKHAGLDPERTAASIAAQ